MRVLPSGTSSKTLDLEDLRHGTSIVARCRQRRSTTKLTALAMASLSHLSCAAQLRDAARRAGPSASAAVHVVVRQISTKPECGFQFQFQFISLIEPEHQGKNSCTDRCP